MTEHDDVARYGADVREALANHTAAEREGMLEDLEEHLAEVAAEFGTPLAAHLGDPARYAAELRAAYGARARRRRLLPQKRRTRALVAALVVLVAIGAWVTWRSAQQPAPTWSQSQLLAAARAGEVQSVAIMGSSAVVTERNGTQHSVHLAGNTERLAAQLTQSNVNVSVEPQGGLPVNIHWGFLLIAVVYLAVVILVVGSIVAAGVYFVRQLLAPRAG